MALLISTRWRRRQAAAAVEDNVGLTSMLLSQITKLRSCLVGPRCWGWHFVICCAAGLGSTAQAQTEAVADSGAGTEVAATQQLPSGMLDFVSAGPDVWTSPEGLSSALQIMLMLTVLSMAPAILLMTTSFIRITIVLGLLRQALGLQQLPPSQVITSIALFMTVLIMTPVWSEIYQEAIIPYTDNSIEMSLEEAWEAGSRPLREFMSRQIQIADNTDDIWLFYDYLPDSDTAPEPAYYEDVPMQVLLPAFMLSELKVAFLIGFNVYLPFLILDVVIASVTISMGMLMLPPVMISLPFKLMLFVLVDGWTLIVTMLLDSFAPMIT